MTRLEQTEKSVSVLDPTEFEAFSTWFEAVQAERWDEQIQTDAIDGKLDRFAGKALADLRAGQQHSL